MANRINRVSAVDRYAQIQQIQRIQRASGPRLTRPQAALLLQWRSRDLPVHVERFLATEFGTKPKNAKVHFTDKGKRALVARLPADRVETLLASTDRHVVAAQAVYFMMHHAPQRAGLMLDNLRASGKLDVDTHQAIFAAINHENPLQGQADLHAILFSARVTHDDIALAEWMLKEDWDTFEAINKAWNDSMRENAEASAKQAKKNALQAREREAQQQADAALAAEAKRSALNNFMQALTNARAQLKSVMRHRSTAQRPLTTSLSSTPSSASSDVSSGSAVQEVEYMQNGVRVHTFQEVSLPGSALLQAAAASSSLLDALAKPSSSVGASIGARALRSFRPLI